MQPPIFRHQIERIILAILISSLFVPPLKLGGFLLNIDDMFILGLLPLLLIIKPNINFVPFVGLFLLLLFSILISIFHGYFYLNVPPSIRDFNEFIRYLKYLFIIIAISQSDGKYLVSKISKLLYYGSYIIIFICFMQFFNFFNIGEAIGSYYSAGHEEHIENLVTGNRILATGSDANVGAAIILYFLLFTIISFIRTQKKDFFVLSVLLLLSLFFTQSRTILIALIILVFLWLLFSRKMAFIYKLIITIFISIVIISFLPYFSYLQSGIYSLSSGTDISFNIRLLMWYNAIELFKESPIIGWGAAKSIHSIVIDGEYVLFLRRYGIIGLLLLIIFITYVPLIILRKKYQFEDEFDLIFTISTSYCFISMFFMFTNNFFSGYKVFIFYLIMNAISYYKIRATISDKQSIIISESP